MTNSTADEVFVITPKNLALDMTICHGALRLHIVIGTFADNEGRAYPSRAKLARLMQCSVRTIDKWLRELVDHGAVTIAHRYKTGTRIMTSSLYTLTHVARRHASRVLALATEPPAEPEPEPAPGVAHETAPPPCSPLRTELEPENYNHSSSTSTPTGADTRPTPSTHSVPVARPIFDRARRQPATNPGNLHPAARRNLRQRLQHIGRLLAAGHHWWDDTTQDAVDTFTADLEHHIPDFADLEHKWSCTAAVADPYQAGVKLNKLIHTAHTGGIHPAA